MVPGTGVSLQGPVPPLDVPVGPDTLAAVGAVGDGLILRVDLGGTEILLEMVMQNLERDGPSFTAGKCR
jgi:hypothetical protein